MKTIVVLGTLDTKGREIEYITKQITKNEFLPLVIDVGILGVPQFKADISRQSVAMAAKTTLDELVKLGDKVTAIDTMIMGATICVNDLMTRNKLDGILAIGGAQGTYIGAKVMQILPFGVPKVIVSVIANGNTTFGPITGTKDIAIIHSVADILGLNPITRSVFDKGVGALIGMINIRQVERINEKKTVGLTAAGVTTACAMMVLENLENLGYEVITFHCSGVAAKAMEELAIEGQVDGILDLSPHNLTDLVTNGIMPAETDRMDFLRKVDVPYVLAPGCADIILAGPISTVPEEWLKRKHYQHNSFHTHIKASYQEMFAVGDFVGKHLRESKRKAAVVIPIQGFSQQNIKGGLIYEPESDLGFLRGAHLALKETSSEKVMVFEFNLHINTSEFAQNISRIFDNLMRYDLLSAEELK